MAQHRSPETISEIARRIRIATNIDHLLAPDIVDFIESRAPHLYPELALIRVRDNELKFAEARTNGTLKTIEVRESVYQAALNGDGRARMTLAHEFGHIALNHAGTRFRSVGDDHTARNIPRVAQEEFEAKRFAAALLIPQHLAERFKSPEDISEQCQVSQQAAQIAYEDAQTAIRRKTRRKRPLPDGIVDFLKAAQKRGIRIRTELPNDD